jgi:hypothetical protein
LAFIGGSAVVIGLSRPCEKRTCKELALSEQLDAVSIIEKTHVVIPLLGVTRPMASCYRIAEIQFAVKPEPLSSPTGTSH